MELSDSEREQLVRWERRRKSSQALALRSRIVLNCAQGRANKQVAAECGVSPATVGKWRRRFLRAAVINSAFALLGLVGTDWWWQWRRRLVGVERRV